MIEQIEPPIKVQTPKGVGDLRFILFIRYTLKWIVDLDNSRCEIFDFKEIKFLKEGDRENEFLDFGNPIVF